jgi:hypothetical protein
MGGIVPSDRPSALIERRYTKGEPGRPPIPLERMLESISCSSSSILTIRALEVRSSDRFDVQVRPSSAMSVGSRSLVFDLRGRY